MSITKKLANFVVALNHDHLPELAFMRAKSATLDYVGVTFAGFPERCSEIVRETIALLGGHPQASVWGTHVKTSVLLAALANGTAAHALDYDDVNSVMKCHPSIQMLPGLFALGEYEHFSGRDILTAYIAGFEVGSKLGRALNPAMVFQGWFPVGVLGTIMQTVACAKLLALNVHQVQMAMGIAANLASGLRCNNGTMAKPLMAGQLGSNGTLAALLARQGLTANGEAIESRFGFFDNFSRGDHRNLAQAIESLGETLDILNVGITTKLYPCCAGSHMAIDCALRLVRENSISPKEIREVHVSISKNVRYLLIHPRPKTEMEAKFSLEYAVSRSILDSQIGIGQFTLDKLEEPHLQILIKKIVPHYYEVPEAPEKMDGIYLPVTVQIIMKNGDSFSTEADCPKGSQGSPLTQAEYENKFRQCVKRKLSEATIEQVLHQIQGFETLPDVNFLTAAFINNEHGIGC